MPEENAVRLGVVVDHDYQLRVGWRVRSMVSENAGVVTDLGHLQVVPVHEQTQTSPCGVSVSRHTFHG